MKNILRRNLLFLDERKRTRKNTTSEYSLGQHIYKKCLVLVWLQEVIPFLFKKGLGFIWDLQHDNT